MSYTQRHIDIESIIWTIQRAEYDLKDYGLDGFSQFEVKKKLYIMKWELDRVLEKSTKFHGEEEWLELQSKQQVWEILKK